MRWEIGLLSIIIMEHHHFQWVYTTSYMGLYDPTRFWDEFWDELLGFTLDVLFSMVQMTEMTDLPRCSRSLPYPLTVWRRMDQRCGAQSTWGPRKHAM